MSTRRTIRTRWALWLASASCAVVLACSLNPQPLPPASPDLDGAAGTGADSSVFAGGDAGMSPDGAIISDSAPPPHEDASDGDVVSDAPVDSPADADAGGD